VLSDICLQCFDAVSWAAGLASDLKETKSGGVLACSLPGAMCRQLYDLDINPMTYMLFFLPDYQFQKVFYVSLGNNILLFFVEAP